ncbi:MAG: O-antigen ligase family protein [bacterium]|nr:O-antigen ligase family protein [bacterium]
MKLHQIFFWVLLFFLPTQLGKHFWPDFTRVLGLQVDYLSPTFYLTDLLMVGLLLAWLFDNKHKRNKLLVIKLFGIGHWLKAHGYLVVFIVYLFLTSLIAQNSGAAIYKFVKILELTALGLYVAKNSVSRSLALPLSLAVLYTSVLTLCQFLRQESLGGLFWFLGERSFSAGTPGIALAQVADRLLLRPYGTFSHPNSLAGFLLIALILVWGFGQKLPTGFKIVVSFLGILAILLSYSQAVWLVLMGILAFLLIKKLSLGKNNFTRLAARQALYFLLFTFAFISVALILKTQSLSDTSLAERWQLIQASVEMNRQSPLWGVGLNNFITFRPRFMGSGTVYLLQPVHNIYLLVVSETGLLGLIIFLWFVLLSIKKALITNNKLLVTVLVSILVLGLFDHYWLTLQQNMLLGTIAFSLAWGTKSNLVNRVRRGKIIS